MKKLFFYSISFLILSFEFFASEQNIPKSSLVKVVDKFKSSSIGGISKQKMVLSGMTVNEVKESLQHKIKPSSEPIPLELILKAGNNHNLFRKKVGININHIVNIVPEVNLGQEVSLQGGHMYKVATAFKNAGFIDNLVSIKDEDTKCWLFDGYDNIIGDKFYKTTFPQGWTVEDIYQSIVNCIQISDEERDSKGRLIIRALIQHKKYPPFTVRCVLYPRKDSNSWELMTVFPEL